MPSWRSSGLSARGGRGFVSQSSGGSACRKVRSENAVRGRVSPLVSLYALTEGREMARTARDGRYLATCLKYVVYNPIRAFGDRAPSWVFVCDV